MKYLKQFSLYTLVGFFNTGINFFLMPYLSHFIKPSEYGILSMINSLVTILIPLIGLVASGLIFVEYYRMDNRKEFARLFSSIQAIPAALGLVFLLITLIFQNHLAAFLEIPLNKSYWIPLSVVIGFLSIYFDTLIVLNITEQKPFQFALFSVSKVLLEVGLTVFLVTFMDLGWEGRMISWMLVSIVFFFVSLFYFRKRGLLTVNLSWKYINSGILFGLPLILHTIGKFVINQSDRVFIAKMVSIDEAGIYNIGYSVGIVLLLIVNAAGNFFNPFLYERLTDLTPASKREIVRTSYLLITVFFITLVAITLGAPLLFSWLIDKSYSKGVVYVFWVGLGYFFWGIYIIFSGFIFYTGKTGFLGKLAVVNVILNVVLNYVLIHYFGALGAAYATCISFFVTAFAIVWKVTTLFKMPWLVRKNINA